MEVKDQLANLEVAKKLGLLESEYNEIVKVMGRTPNFNELSIFSVMWSEHCSYKNSILWLKKLPKKGDHLLVEAGEENAGLVDIGDGLACAFKIESHNHPSAIEPYQGAATGVGGIHRDIFTMGARPLAAMNSLRFGDIENEHTKSLIRGVVKGIGDYGNCFGVPTIGGETYFNSCYNQNILVNAFSAGIVEVDKTISAIADGPGNPVFIVGSATGKDGIHGATFASADLNEDSSNDLPSVQVGDPFQEKLLLEATLELAATDVIVGMQDMGAAGISCSSSEMSAKSKTGMKINLDLVPTRQDDMEPFEILLSESQERMLVVCKKGREKTMTDIFDKWDLECAQIGVVTDTGRLEFSAKGKIVADLPAEPLVLGGGAPVYEREYTEPTYFKELKKFDINTVPDNIDILDVAKKMIQLPNICSKKWIYEQYDSMVRTNSMNTNNPSDAAVIRIKDSEKGLAMTVDCNPGYVYADPFVGTMIAVTEAARNIVCSGGNPSAITNCLNFGNPYDPEVYWQFVNAIKGMSKACLKFGTPVTGGNVSFYNQFEKDGKTYPVYPTPTIGMMGVLEDTANKMDLGFEKEGHQIYLLGDVVDCINSSEYLREIKGITKSSVPYFDLDKDFELQELTKKIIKSKLIRSAHDVSDGGLFVNLLESAMVKDLSFTVNKNNKNRSDAFWFGEGQGRIVVSVETAKEFNLLEVLNSSNVNFTKLGYVNSLKNDIFVDNINFGNIKEWKNSFYSRLNDILEQ